MQIVTTHTNTDFDGLASMVACTCLFPGTIGVLPSHVMPGVKAFMAIHQDLLRIKPRKTFDLDLVDRLIVVDTNQWGRMDGMKALKTRPGLVVTCWDHHMAGNDIEAHETRREEVGATVTLILEEMEQQQIPFTPMQATLFLLGIYHDTGCLTFSSATPRDARMTAFLLENGADLNLVSAYLSEAIDDPHSKVFTQMLDNGQVMSLDGLTIGILALPVQSGLTMLSSLVEKYKAFKGLNAVFGLFITDQDKVMVIGRSDPRTIDVGSVVRALGGGGHPAAGAAVVRESTLADVKTQVLDLIQNGQQNETLVKDMMIPATPYTLNADATLRQAAALLEKISPSALVITENRRFIGLLTQAVVEKAAKNNRLDTPVKSSVTPQVQTLSPLDNARTAMQKMNATAQGLLPVIDQDGLAGILTRGNLILHIYEI